MQFFHKGAETFSLIYFLTGTPGQIINQDHQQGFHFFPLTNYFCPDRIPLIHTYQSSFFFYPASTPIYGHIAIYKTELLVEAGGRNK